MKVVASLGRKGGSGKTMIAHLLAHGLSKGYGIFVNLVMTDVREDRPAEMNPNREYFVSSIRNKNPETDAKELQKLFEQTEQMPDSVLILDGGANRANMDQTLAQFSDLVMIPVGFGTEDIKVAETDFWKILKTLEENKLEADVCILRNRWPGAEKRRAALLQRKWVGDFLQRAERTRMLFPDYVPDMPSLLDMSNSDDPKTTPLIDAISVRFAELVAAKIGLVLPEKRKLGGGFGSGEASKSMASETQSGDDQESGSKIKRASSDKKDEAA